MRKAYLTLLMWTWIGMSTYAQYLSSVESYIEQHKEIAIEEMHRTGIPASIILSQGILASNYGNSELVFKGNNHFNRKCLHQWKGGKLYRNGQLVSECYRIYNNATESFQDHTNYIMNSDWFTGLFQFDVKNYKAWATGLHNAGYDTSNPYYGDQLIQIIEKYQLSQLDAATPYESIVIARQATPPTVSQIIPPISSQVDVVNNRTANPQMQVITNIHEFDFNHRPIENDLINLDRELIRNNPQAVKTMRQRFKQKRKIMVTPLKLYKETSNRIKQEGILQSMSNTGEKKTPANQFFLAARLQYVNPLEIIFPDSVTPNKFLWQLAASRSYQLNEEKEEEGQKYLPLHTLYNLAKITETPVPERASFKHNGTHAVRYDYPVSVKQIAKTYQKSMSKLLDFNDLVQNAYFPAYTNIFLQKKKKKSKNKRHHRVKRGESMWKIAQFYGIQMAELYRRNLLYEGQEPRTEEVLLLRGKATYPPKITTEKSDKKQEYRHKRSDPAGIHYTKRKNQDSL